MPYDLRDIILGLACCGHLCWGALGAGFFVLSWVVSRRQPPVDGTLTV